MSVGTASAGAYGRQIYCECVIAQCQTDRNEGPKLNFQSRLGADASGRKKAKVRLTYADRDDLPENRYRDWPLDRQNVARESSPGERRRTHPMADVV